MDNVVFIPPTDDPLPSLSPTEAQIFALLLDGCNRKQISLRLKLTYNNIGQHEHNIRRKLKAETTLHAVRLYATRAAFEAGVRAAATYDDRAQRLLARRAARSAADKQTLNQFMNARNGARKRKE